MATGESTQFNVSGFSSAIQKLGLANPNKFKVMSFTPLVKGKVGR